MVIDNYNKELAQAYKLLGTLFLHGPDKELLENLQKELDLEIEEPIEEIREEYDRLLADRTALLPPYESLYHYDDGETPALWNKTTERVIEFYRISGLDLDISEEIPPDHLGLELLFVSYLMENEMVEELREFFREHIMKWIPQYCDELREQTQTAFFKDIAEATKEVITSDYEELE